MSPVARRLHRGFNIPEYLNGTSKGTESLRMPPFRSLPLDRSRKSRDEMLGSKVFDDRQ